MSIETTQHPVNNHKPFKEEWSQFEREGVKAYVKEFLGTDADELSGFSLEKYHDGEKFFRALNCQGGYMIDGEHINYFALTEDEFLIMVTTDDDDNEHKYQINR